MNFVVIAPEQLQEDTLNAVVTSFILREGTDYGAQEISLETKLNQVKKQIAKEQIKIVFDPSTESLTLMTALDFKKMSATAQIPSAEL